MLKSSSTRSSTHSFFFCCNIWIDVCWVVESNRTRLCGQRTKKLFIIMQFWLNFYLHHIRLMDIIIRVFLPMQQPMVLNEEPTPTENRLCWKCIMTRTCFVSSVWSVWKEHSVWREIYYTLAGKWLMQKKMRNHQVAFSPMDCNWRVWWGQSKIRWT